MVTVKTSGEKILQTDTKSQESIVNEKDSSGGTRQNVDRSEDTETILVGDSSAEPYIVQEIMPQVEGVLVACQGGDKATVQSEISGAIQALFGIEAHKIKVCKKAS
jgi:stage III sporulation protein AG